MAVREGETEKELQQAQANPVPLCSLSVLGQAWDEDETLLGT